ncbi:sodium:solute symporter family protein|uniref:Solute:Na+ symporter, SSS family n=1 Tax=Dendrosporobacter quercicolus TaxID=146817 RepID=A0A1G9WAH5_9FIRM|nr:sodium:solute symporter family protein [Dendrosporobacter quercicolus]NSL47675.1 sodium:solute symporter family protein [Dendrosporobacter quercicolus DSM 1736]SDM81287.1 solute:Na+ symporter, SSS family [Dendrosporobacter quercicolus]
MNIPLIIVSIYIALLFIISYYAKKRAAGSSTNYVLAGRRLTTPLITVSIVGLAVGGASTIGVAEQAYKVGLSAGWYTTAWGIGAIVMGMLVAKKYRELNITTIPELLGRYYDKKGMIAGVACQIVIQLVVMSLQYIAGGSILHALVPEVFTFTSGILTSAAVFIGITAIGGMWSASLCNVLNVSLKYIGIILAVVFCITRGGGIENIKVQLPANVPYFDLFDGVGLWGILSWIIVLVTVNLSLQSIIQISLGAKDVQTARRGFIIGGLMMLPIGFVSAMLGVIAKTMFPDASPALALPMTIMSLNPVLAGITLAALWAADVSTACSLLLSSATLFSQDIYKKFINPAVSEKQFLAVTKGSVLVLGLLTLVFAMTISGIINTLMIGLSLTAAFSAIVLFTLFAPQLCRKNSAFYTILTGLAVLILWQTVPAVRVFPHVIYLEWLACVGAFLLTYVLDQVPISSWQPSYKPKA